jgi:cholera toxin transcriptional activator
MQAGLMAVLNYAPQSVEPASHPGTLVRFGVYEADLSAGELRKKGAKIRLQEQPFQLLAYLLERKGSVVTREDLREKLWASDTFVDFDHSLNTAVNKVRDALGDSASNPRFVETLARRGYRFIAPVEWLDGAVDAEVPSTELQGHKPAGIPMDSELGVPLPHRGLVRGLFALIQIMYLVFYVVALVRLQAVHGAASEFLPGWGAFTIQVAVLITAAIGIPLRLYLLSSVAFDHQGLGENFRKLFLFVLIFDQLWAIAPFLLTEKIGIGGAFAATAALLYVPFAERTLVRMAYKKMA